VDAPSSILTELDAGQRIPNKLYFRIGDVSSITGVKPHVLRYWESEFPLISPKKTSSGGHRLYRRKDVELFLEIKHLLYEKRYTIEGARKAMERRPGKGSQKAAAKALQPALFGESRPDLTAIRSELAAILELLRRDR
jgi:DNA-binding transcriptional MerR regulator